MTIPTLWWSWKEKEKKKLSKVFGIEKVYSQQMQNENKKQITNKKQGCVDKILFDSDNIIFYDISDNIKLLDDI